MIKSAILMFAAIGLFGFFQSCESSEAAPSTVTTAFSEKFPTATDAKWEKENDTEWEAEFKLDGKEYSANFATDGTWKETEYEVEKSEIPAAVQLTLDSTFVGYNIEEVEMTETATSKAYEIALEKGKEHLEAVIDLEGKVLRQEVKKYEKGEKHDKD
jgi:hypothetical protein